jgi:peptidoglycan hydrolase-like protein with peptidoglycan-binding domain
MERGPMLRNLSTAALGTLVATALLAAAQPARAQGDEPLGKSLNESKRATLEVQVWLARANASPGPFDGLEGKNTELAIRAFQKMQDAEATGTLTDEQRATLKSKHGETPLLVEYEITQDDVKGPFLDKIPGSMQEMAELERLSFTSAKEMLAEKFQSYPDLLDELNPEANYDEAGGMIIVPNVDGIGPPPEVARIEINREDSTLFAYDGGRQIDRRLSGHRWLGFNALTVGRAHREGRRAGAEILLQSERTRLQRRRSERTARHPIWP